jgi:uncharacterized membrane protein YhhN
MGWRTIVLAAALVAGVSYLFAGHAPVGPASHTAWKGAGVGLLALYAAVHARTSDGWLLAAVLALGALGDVLLETSGLTIGAVAFLAGHLVAIGLYLRNRRPVLSLSQGLLAAVMLVAIPLAAYLLPADRALAPLAALYALGLAAMAASAWISRFPRYWVGLGAAAFAASDLFLFARAGPLAGAPWVDAAVWGLYFGGQAMIALGVTRTLARPSSTRARSSGRPG